MTNPYGGYVDERRPISYLEGQETYTQILADAGYEMAMSGKWHLGDSLHPQCGFSDRWYTIGKGGAHYMSPDIIENGEVHLVKEYVTNLFTKRALDYLEDMKDSPFYLGLHYTAPHSPWEEDNHPKEMIDLYEDCPFDSIPDVPDHPDLQSPPVHGTPRRKMNLRGYFAAVTGMDKCIGKVLEHVEELGLQDNTYIIFMSDNGMCMGQHGVWGKGNGTFPQNMYEESIKVPCIIAGPGIEPAVIDDMYSQLDMFPTILELAGIDYDKAVKDTKARPGMSFAPLLRGESMEGRKAAYIYDEYGTVRMVRTKKDKYVQRAPFGPHEYFDLENDPHEADNRYENEADQERILELKRNLDAWYVEYANPKYDGTRQGVAGFGQLDVVDKPERLDLFYTKPWF